MKRHVSAMIAISVVIAFTGLLASPSQGQRLEQRDVLVVYNGQSSISRTSAYYYAFSRRLSLSMLLDIDLPLESTDLLDPADESITRADYQTMIREPVANRLASLGADAPTMIVLAPGIPLRILDDSGSWILLVQSTGASVDAELAVLGSELEGSPGILTSSNPYFGSLQSFESWRDDHPEAPLRHLVSRLAGYPEPVDQFGLPTSIRRLVDRAQLPADPAGIWVVDEDGSAAPSRQSVNMQLLRPATGLLRLLGESIVHDTTTNVVKNLASVMGYASWGSNDPNSPTAPYYGVIGASNYPGNFSPRSIASTIVSTNARSFVSPPTYGQSLVADLVEVGAAGVAGNVSEPGAFQIVYPQILFTRYAIGSTAIEAYYASLPYLGWMNIWVGDPLMRRVDPDQDADAVPDRIDRCGDTPASLTTDSSGCSQVQFCALFDPGVDDDSLVAACRGADWLDDEPWLRKPRDCRDVSHDDVVTCEPA